MTCAGLRPLMLIAAAAVYSLADCAPAESADAEPPRYVRAYVPVDGVEDWPRGGAVLEPISAREFEDLADFMEPRRRVPDAQITSAQFEAELLAGGLLTGTAVLTVSCRSKKSVFVPWDPCTLAVGDVQWHDEGAAPQLALLGVDNRGNQRLRVDQSGKLNFTWSLRGDREAAGKIEFYAELPPALSHRVLLDLPDGITPEVQAAIVTRLTETAAKTIRWQIDLGSHTGFRMRLLPRDDETWHPLSLVRQATTYEFSPQGVNVGVELRLDVPHDPLPQLSVAVDSPLEIVQATLGETPVEFSQSPEAEGPRQVTFHFPAPIHGAKRTLRLWGVAPLTTGRRWQLPRVRPQGPHWLSGEATLLIRKPLALADLSLTQGRQSRVAALVDEDSDPEFELQLFSPEAAIEVLLQRSASKLDVAAATRIELTDAEISGRLTADVTTDGPDRFVVGTVLSSGWEVVGEIESIPPGAIHVDKVDVDGMESDTMDDRQRYSINVKRGIAPDRPLKLRINARKKLSSQDRPIEQRMFRMVEFDDVGEFRNLIYLRARGSQHLETQGAEHLNCLTLDELDAGDVGRVEGGEPALMWLDVPQQDRLRIELKQQPPHFTTQSSVEARVTKEVVQRRLQIDCSPRASVLENVVISFASEAPPPPRWRVVNQPEVRVTVDRWAPENGDFPLQPIGAASWKLSFSQPLSQDFRLVSEQTLPLEDSFFVDVFAVRGAERQAGRVTIYCDDDATLTIDNRGLQPVPAPPPPAGRINSLRGAFRYEPVDAVAAGRGIVVSLQPEESPLAAAREAWAWSATVESLVGTDGISTHRATFAVENDGLRRLAVGVPGRGTPTIYVDGDEAATVAEPDARRWYVELPAGNRFFTLQIDYETRFAPSPWAVIRATAQPRPELQIPVLAWRGVVHTPPGYLGVTALDAPLDGQVLSWRQRLLGPLGRGPRGAVFDPFDGRTWSLVEPGRNSGGEEDGQNVPVRSRTAGDVNADDPWGAPEPLGDLATSERGWNTLVHHFDDGAADRVLLVDLTALEALKWTIFLAVFCGVSWRPPRRFSVRVTVLAALGVVALFTPALLASLVTSALLGFAAALLMHRIRRAVSSLVGVGGEESLDAAASANSKPTVATVSEGLAMLAAMLICWPATSTGQPPPASAPAAPAPVYRVFIPYADDPTKPAGDSYYISSEFDRALQPVRALRAQQQPTTLIRDAKYRGAMAWEPGRTRLTVDRLTAVYEVEASAGNAVVRIPLDRARAGVPADGVTLDGGVVEPVWNATGSEFSLPIPGAGTYRLEIELRPNPEFVGPVNRVEFDIPALCTSQLVLDLPGDAQAVEVPSARGRLVRDGTQHRLVADLGASSQLTLTWPGGRAAQQASRPVDVQQLGRLKIQPAAVTLDAQIRLKADRIRTVTLAADPRLQLISQSFNAPDASIRIVRVRVEHGNPQFIELELEETVYGQQQVHLSFLVADTSGVGAIQIPRLNVVDARTLRQFVAVSLDPSLQIDAAEFAPNETLRPVSIDELGGEWDLSGLRTALIYEQTRADAEFSLPTKLQTPTTRGTEQLALRRDHQEIHVSYQAELETRNGYLFQHRATVPGDFVADRVTILADGASRDSKAFQHGENQLTVFLAAPLTGRHVLEIDGRRPRSDRADAAAKIHLADCEIRESVVRPQQVDGQKIPREAIGPRPQAPPSERDGPHAESDPQRTVSAPGSLDDAALTSRESRHGKPKVLLADIQVDWHSDGRYAGFAVFDVEPAGAESLRLVLPSSECKLVATRVAGLTAAAGWRDAGQWDLPLSSAQFPQRIEVLYEGPWVKKGRGRRQFRSPVLRFADKDISVVRTLWTVAAPAEAGRTLSTSPSSREVTLLEQHLERFGHIESILAGVPSDESSDAFKAWYQGWALEFLQAGKRIEALYANEANPETQRHAMQVEDRIAEFGNRPFARQVFDSLSHGGPDVLMARHYLGRSSPRAGAMTRVATDGPRPWLEIDYRPRSRGDGWQRIVVAIIIMAAAAALLRVQRLAGRLKSAVWLPPLACFLAGVLGWLLLSPGLLGLILVGLAPVMALRLGWAK